MILLTIICFFSKHFCEPFPKWQISDASKLKKFGDDNFKFDENGRKFLKWVENIVGKGEILVMSNFSFSHSVFNRLILQTRKTRPCFGKGLKDLLVQSLKHKICFLVYHTLNPFPNKPRFSWVCSTSLWKTPWEKEEIACNKQFLLFPQCFLPIWGTFCHFHQIWNCRLQTLSLWKSLKLVIWERVNNMFCAVLWLRGKV